MNLKQYSSHLILCIMMMLLPAISSYSQESDFVRPGPGGLFIGLGNSVPCGVKTTAYKIERSGGGDSWNLVAELKTPATFPDFMAKVELNKSMFTGNVVPAKDQLEKLWQKAHQSGIFEPADAWVLSFPVRMAFGILYLDRDVKENGTYKYRVTARDASGGTLTQNISGNVKWPVVPIFDTIKLVALERSSKLLSMKWKSVGKNPAQGFRLYFFDNETPRLMPGKAIIYVKNDTANYLYQDASPETLGNKGLMCYLVPEDTYGNEGKAGVVLMIGSESFNKVHFSRTKAAKVRDYLGIQLTWSLSGTALVKKIEVYRSLDPQNNFQLITTLSPADTSFVDPNVVPDKVHYYHLRACGEFDFQTVRSNAFFDYGLDPRPPVTPAIYQSCGIKNGVELAVLLNDVNMSGIRVYRSNGLNDSLQAIGDLVRNDSNTLVIRDTSAGLNGYYYYQYAVKSENTSHQLSAFSNTVAVRPLKPTYPDPPVAFQAYLDNQKVKLFWNNGDLPHGNIQGYRLTRSETGGNITEEVVLSSNFYVDSLVKPGKTYTYGVKTIDIYNGVSQQSSVVTIEIPASLPIPPTDLKAINTPEGVVLEWGPAVSDNSSMYRIYRFQRGVEPEVIKLVGKEAITYTDTTVKKDQLYFYYLTTLTRDDTESAPCAEVGIYR